MISPQDIKDNEQIKTYIRRADDTLSALGFTEHSFAHVTRVAHFAEKVLRELGYDDRTCELAWIAGYMHDIGNVINRIDHAQSGAVTLGVRPEHIMLCASGTEQSIKASVDVSEMMGSSIHLHVTAGGKDVVMVIATVDLPSGHESGFRYGDEVNFTFGGNVLHIFDTETGKALT